MSKPRSMRFWRSRRHASGAIALGLMLATTGCERDLKNWHPPPPDKNRVVQREAGEESHISDEDVLERSPFRFARYNIGVNGTRLRWQLDGDGRVRMSMLARVERDSEARELDRRCHVYLHNLEASAVTELRRRLVSVGFVRLGRLYSAGWFDLPVMAHRLTIGDDTKVVSCDGACPKVMRPILEWMTVHIPDVPNITSYPIEECPREM